MGMEEVAGWIWPLVCSLQTLGLESIKNKTVKIFFFTSLYSMWDLSSLTRDQILTPCIGNVKS